MNIKLISIAFIATLIVGLPSLLLLSADDGLLLETRHFPVIALGIFMIAMVSALLGNRLQPSGRKNDQSDDEIREIGTVKWFNASKGFGFITRDSGDDVFVHFRSIRGEGHRVLHDGQRVEFFVSQGDKGLQAEDVAVAH